MPEADDKDRAFLVSRVKRLVDEKYHGDMRLAFSSYDEMGKRDDRLSARELTDLLADADVGNFATRKLWVNRIMKSVDTDQNAHISWHELESIMKAK